MLFKQFFDTLMPALLQYTRKTCCPLLHLILEKESFIFNHIFIYFTLVEVILPKSFPCNL